MNPTFVRPPSDGQGLLTPPPNQNVCGVSVVGDAFDSLRRFNLAELAQIDQDPPPPPPPDSASSKRPHQESELAGSLASPPQPAAPDDADKQGGEQ